MGKLIKALKHLGKAINGEEPNGKYVSEVIDDIATTYEESKNKIKGADLEAYFNVLNDPVITGSSLLNLLESKNIDTNKKISENPLNLLDGDIKIEYGVNEEFHSPQIYFTTFGYTDELGIGDLSENTTYGEFCEAFDNEVVHRGELKETYTSILNIGSDKYQISIDDIELLIVDSFNPQPEPNL